MSAPRGKQLKTSDFKIAKNGVYINNLNQPAMLLIWASWCGHCHRFIPNFNEICNKLGDKFPCLSIESEELNKSSKLNQALDFKGFPTIKFIDQNGKIIEDYDGDRSKSGILTHICEVYHKCYQF
jgi:thiol-disulfide isomerase/thioredoxin